MDNIKWSSIPVSGVHMILTKISQKPFPIKPSLEIRRILTPQRPSRHKMNFDFDWQVRKFWKILKILINLMKNSLKRHQIFAEIGSHYAHECNKNGRIGAHGLKCKIFVNSELKFKIYDKNYPRKNFFMSLRHFWNFRDLKWRVPRYETS